MTIALPDIRVALEIGPKRVIASALDWSGWARVGRDEFAALEALCAYGRRYQRAIGPAIPDFRPPDRVESFEVAERLTGSATTDFGVPEQAPSVDADPLDAADLHRLLAILGACWDALDIAAASAEGRELRKGPRGGGRSAPAILDHVIDAHFGYLRRLTWRIPMSGVTIAQPNSPQSRRSMPRRSHSQYQARCRRPVRAAASSGRRATSSAAPPGTSSTTPGK